MADRVSQIALLALADTSSAPRVSQVAMLVLEAPGAVPRVSQVARLVLGDYTPCLTHRAQLWRITRTDGEVLAFTSHDQPIRYGLHTFTPCDSLQASASQQTAQMEQEANVELRGIISDDGIREIDVQAGRYDDAYVEVFLVAWQEPADGVIAVDSVRRLNAGWIGGASVGNGGVSFEVLGPGARLAQRSVMDVYSPQCRWTLGDTNCGIDLEPMKAPGIVTAVVDLGQFEASLVLPTGAAQYDQGYIVWTSGDNLGAVCDVKVVELATGSLASVVLWETAPFTPALGDTFDLFPGCDGLAATCKGIYENKPNFGGFDRVPGNDAIMETPDAKN